MPKQMGRAIAGAALITGTADILLACFTAWLRNKATPELVLKFIASGLIGKQAFRGGIEAVLLGLLLHYFIALLFTILLFLIYPSLRWIHQNRILAGILYGVFVWLVMNEVVVPLSSTPPAKMDAGQVITSMLVLIVAIGMPVVWLAGRFYGRSEKLKVKSMERIMTQD